MSSRPMKNRETDFDSFYRKNQMTAGDNPPIGLLLCNTVGRDSAECLAPVTDKELFLSEYQLHLPGKEAFTVFLKQENEGLAKPMDTKKCKAKRVSK